MLILLLLMPRSLLRGLLTRRGFVSFHFTVMDLDAQGLPIYQSLGDFSACAADDAVERLPRDFHALRGFLPIHPFAIPETERLQFIGTQLDFLQVAKRNSRWLEIGRWGRVSNVSGARRS